MPPPVSIESEQVSSTQATPPKAHNRVIVKLFGQHFSGRRVALGLVLLPPNQSDIFSLASLRPLIAAQVDFPSFLIDAISKQTQRSNQLETEKREGEKSLSKDLWASIPFKFNYQGCPVGQSQEELITISSLENQEIDLTFDVPKPALPLQQQKESKKKGTAKVVASVEETLGLFDEKQGSSEQTNSAGSSSPANPQIKPEDITFRIVLKDVISCQTGLCIGKEKYLYFENDQENPSKKSAEICSVLRNITKNATFYDKEPKVKLNSFLSFLQMIQNNLKTSEHNKKLLHPLVTFLEREFADTIKTVSQMTEHGQISFGYLWFLFPKETEFLGQIQGELVGSKVLESRYQESFFGTSFKVSGSLIKSNGVGLSNATKWFSIDEFEGLLLIKDLPIKPLSEERKRELSQRGKVYREISQGAHYLQYRGSLSIQQWFSIQKFKADGRIMVDPVSFNRFNPNYSGFRFNTDEEKGIDHIPDEKLFMTWPTVPGFSFACKKWGEFLVSKLEPVHFNDNAFEQLVMDAEKKRLIKCLVQNSSKSFADIISGKGGGVIFLLHGTPGVGKTLTAEAVSELLHRPLYCVNIGELGVTTTQLEEKLSQILEMASTWNAIILLDEADIFLERRTENDVKRNALVGIFLRLLEYHQGVLFLTTNRVKSFDEAFHSRISIALHYQPLDQLARKKIWENLLDAAKIEGDLDPEELSNYELNGRQIKNIIRLAQTIAIEENKRVSKTDVQRCVEVARQFQQDILHD